MRVRLVIDSNNRRWIIGKLASRLEEHLGAFGVEADIAEEPLVDADVNHWLVYPHPWQYYFRSAGFYQPGWSPGPSRNTVLITHIDDPVKLNVVRESVSRIVDVAICMSRMTKAELAGHGIDPSRLTYINPAHDAEIAPRRIVIGITSRLYGDARKREDILLSVAEAMRLDSFRFEIFGEGWDAVARRLEEAGAEVAIFLGSDQPDGGYARIRQHVPGFDYYLYLGWDEGSMGTLDALSAGVKTILTPQGFHLDVEGGITHVVRTATDLSAVLHGIEDERLRRVDSVRALTWNEYARKHAAVWRAIAEGRLADVPAEAGERSIDHGQGVEARDLETSRARLLAKKDPSYLQPQFAESRRFRMRGRLGTVRKFLVRLIRRRAD